MESKDLLSGLLHNNRGKLSLTYALSLTEQLLGLSLPWAIGEAINGLLASTYNKLAIFIGIWLVLVFLTTGRKMYDTRVFMRIYAKVVTNVINQQRDAGTASSKLVARSVLIRELVDFFERDIPDIFAMVIAFIGSLSMLALFDWHVALIALAMLVPVSIMNLSLWRPINKLNRSLNNNLERQAQVINKGNQNRLLKHFQFLRILRVKSSDIEARSWSIIELFVILATICVLVYTTRTPNIAAGTVFSIVTYFWNFQESLDRLPVLMQAISRVKDILQRTHGE